MWDPKITIEFVNDPAEAERHWEARAHYDRNSNWLQNHWPELLPQARGKILAVAGQEAHVAETPEEAWKWTKEHHPEDKGPIVQFVFTNVGPRCYDLRRRMVQL